MPLPQNNTTPPEVFVELLADFKTEGLTGEELSTPQAILSLQTAIAQVAFPSVVPPPFQLVEILQLINLSAVSSNASLGRRSLRATTSSVLVKSRILMVQDQIYSASLSILNAGTSGA
jgi:hypothetical protein